MPVALKRARAPVKPETAARPLMHLIWFVTAGLYVEILAMSYGLDLSPGLF